MVRKKPPDNRDISLDFIRVVSMIFVIGAHTSPKPMARSPLFTAAFLMILLTCNSNFYMLSGELNLSKRFETAGDYRRYFAGKAVSLLFPYLLVTAMLTVWNMAVSGGEITLSSYVKHLYLDIMAENNKIHLWFMYPLVGMLLSAPFLSRMVNAISDTELHIMFVIGILWGIVSIYFTADWDVGFAYSDWLWDGWSLTFFAGYYSRRVIKEENKAVWYGLGLICFVINLLGTRLIPQHNKHWTDLAPAFLIFSMAAYTFLKNEIPIKGELPRRVIFFLASHSFTVYLVHYNVISSVTVKILRPVKPAVCFFLSAAVTFAVSLLIAVVLDGCVIHPVQRYLKNRIYQK